MNIKALSRNVRDGETYIVFSHGGRQVSEISITSIKIGENVGSGVNYAGWVKLTNSQAADLICQAY